MSKQKVLLQNLLKERKIEKDLKDYFKYLDSVYGEDYATQVLSLCPSLKKSIQYRTDKFNYTSDEDIILSLLKSSVLSRDTNSYINLLVKSYIAEGELEELFDLVIENYSVRKMLTRNFIRDSYGNNWDLYHKKNDNDNTLGNLLTLRYYNDSLNYNRGYKK